MQAIVVHSPGGPETLSYESVPVPEPGVGEARVKIEAAGVNFIDVYHRSGLYKLRLPAVLGMEAAGAVDAVGPKVEDLGPGSRVAYAMVPGAYAEYAVVPVEKLVAIPDGIDTQQAAAVMLQGMTAHYLTHNTYRIQPGDTALIHAAGGGVGQLLVQIAKRRGARVIGTASTEEKARLAAEAGADEVILYTQVDFEEEVKRQTDGAGVHVVYDSVGKVTFYKSLRCLRRRGYMVLFGQSSGPVPSVDIAALAKGSLFVTRPGLPDHIADQPELLGRAGDLFTWMAAGELKVSIDRTFSLAEAAAAHRYLEDRKTKGKVLLLP
jgi:NADPH2:quinone reductase